MSCEAEAKAISHSTASDIWKKWSMGSVSATPASSAPTTNCSAQIQRRLVPSNSTSGLHSGLMTQGR